MSESRTDRRHRPAGHRPAAHPASAVLLADDMATGAAVAEILQTCLNDLVANASAISIGGDPEAVHQARVALRRLRSALGLFRSCWPDEGATTLAAQARTLAAVLGAARSVDVLIHFLDAAPELKPKRREALRNLRRRVIRRRRAAYRQLARRLADDETSQFILTLKTSIARLREGGGAALDRPVGRSAMEGLSRRLDRALRSRRNPARRSPAARHQLRIDLKKLRYAADFFASLPADRDGVADYLGCLGNLQTDLGRLNDRVDIRQMLLLLDSTGKLTASLLRPGQKEEAQHLHALAKDWRRFRKAEPFWKAGFAEQAG